MTSDKTIVPESGRGREEYAGRLFYELEQSSITFLARARECCEELNPNNYNPKSALWKAREDLESCLGKIENLKEAMLAESNGN